MSACSVEIRKRALTSAFKNFIIFWDTFINSSVDLKKTADF